MVGTDDFFLSRSLACWPWPPPRVGGTEVAEVGRGGDGQNDCCCPRYPAAAQLPSEPVRLCNPVDCSPPGSSVHGILQAGTLDWGATPSSRGSSWPKDRTPDSCVQAGAFTVWAGRDAPSQPQALNVLPGGPQRAGPPREAWLLSLPETIAALLSRCLPAGLGAERLSLLDGPSLDPEEHRVSFRPDASHKVPRTLNEPPALPSRWRQSGLARPRGRTQTAASSKGVAPPEPLRSAQERRPAHCLVAAVQSLRRSDSVRPRGREPSRLLCPWDFRGRTLSGLPCPAPGGLPDPPGLNWHLLHCRRIFTAEPPGKSSRWRLVIKSSL